MLEGHLHLWEHISHSWYGNELICRPLYKFYNGWRVHVWANLQMAVWHSAWHRYREGKRGHRGAHCSYHPPWMKSDVISFCLNYCSTLAALQTWWIQFEFCKHHFLPLGLTCTSEKDGNVLSYSQNAIQTELESRFSAPYRICCSSGQHSGSIRNTALFAKRTFEFIVVEQRMKWLMEPEIECKMDLLSKQRHIIQRLNPLIHSTYTIEMIS